MIGDRRVVHHVAELASVGAGGVQADQRNSLPGLLEIDPMRPPLDRERGSSGRRSARRCAAISALLGEAARRREQVLEIQQVGHQRVEIALDAQLAALGEGEDVMEVRRRKRLPELAPRIVGTAERERPRPHQQRPTIEPRDPAARDRHVVGNAPDLDQDVEVEMAPSAQQSGIAVHELRQPRDHAVHRRTIRTQACHLAARGAFAAAIRSIISRYRGHARMRRRARRARHDGVSHLVAWSFYDCRRWSTTSTRVGAIATL